MIIIHTIREGGFRGVFNAKGQGGRAAGEWMYCSDFGKAPRRHSRIKILDHRLQEAWSVRVSGILQPAFEPGLWKYRVNDFKEIDYKKEMLWQRKRLLEKTKPM